MTPGSNAVAGVDGGATHMRVLVRDGSGTEWAAGVEEGSLLGEGADEAVADRIAETLRRAGGSGEVELPLSALCVGLAGAAGRPESRRLCEARLAAAGVAQVVRVVSDSEIALVDAFGESGEGILLISGTGSVGVGRVSGSGEREMGRIVRVGGWGALLGDEGSAYRIGLEGIRAAVRGEEGRGPETALLPLVLEAIGGSSLQDLLGWSDRAAKAEIARLAPLVVRTGTEGDAASDRIVALAVEELAMHARALRVRYWTGSSAPPVALVGALIAPGGPLRSGLEAALTASGFTVQEGHVSPERGAARMAEGFRGRAGG